MIPTYYPISLQCSCNCAPFLTPRSRIRRFNGLQIVIVEVSILSRIQAGNQVSCLSIKLNSPTYLLWYERYTIIYSILTK